MTENDANQIRKYDAFRVLQNTFGTGGAGAGELRSPAGIGIDADGTVYISDFGNDRIQVFSADGEYLRRWGSTGRGERNFVDPESIIVDAAGHLLIADFGNHRIVRYTTNGRSSSSSADGAAAPAN